MNDALAIETAALIAEYNPAAAAAYLAKPFHRVTLALAFARGFGRTGDDDVHPVAAVVLRSAYADQHARAA